MGAYSEKDLELRSSNDAFSDDEDVSAFAEDTPMEPPEPEAKQTQQNVTPPPASPVSAQDNEPQAQSDADKTAEVAEAKVDEDEKRRAHEAAEAKRKAEWEARQQAKKAAEQEQLDRLAAMSDDEVMASSMKRVSADTEKLTRRNMKECVAEHIQTMCLEDPVFARKTMHPRKSMIRCFQYINRKAWDYVQDELKASGIQPGPGQQGYGSDIPDDLCYQWATDYFNDPDAKEDHEEEEEFVPKPYYGGAASKSKKKTKAKDKKAPAPQKADAKETEKKPSETLGQLTLGDFTVPEELAG